MADKARWTVYVFAKPSGELLLKKQCHFVTDINEEMAVMLGINWRDQVEIKTEYDFTDMPFSNL